MTSNAKKFIGNGLNFPLRVNARGAVALVTGNEDIEQSIRIILQTRPGERVMRPNFGCLANDLAFEPRTAGTISLLQNYVLEALRLWEPRVEVMSVQVSSDAGNDGALLTEIVYMIKATHDTRSIVYPFFISDEPEYQ